MSFYMRRSYKIINLTAHPAHRTFIFHLLAVVVEAQIFFLRNLSNLDDAAKEMNSAAISTDDVVFLTYISPENNIRRATRHLFI